VTRTFGARLRAHRERNGIALERIAESTKISIGLLEGLERDDTSRWPSGIYRRAFIRAYARASGLDPESTLGEFLEHFPDPADERRPAAADGDGASTAAQGAPLRLTLDDEQSGSIRGRIALSSARQRGSAAVYDLVIVTAIAALVFGVARIFWTPFLVATIGYYFGGIVMLGNSVGAWLVVRRGRPARAGVSTPPQLADASVVTVEPPRRFNPASASENVISLSSARVSLGAVASRTRRERLRDDLVEISGR